MSVPTILFDTSWIQSCLTEVLGIKDIGVLTSMQTLREMLCAEPSIHGGKKSKCDLDAELAKLKLKGDSFSEVGMLTKLTQVATYMILDMYTSFFTQNCQ